MCGSERDDGDYSNVDYDHDDIDDDRAIRDCMYRYIMYPRDFIDDDCIAPPDKGSYIHYI